jgi:hypothetical protein
LFSAGCSVKNYPSARYALAGDVVWEDFDVFFFFFFLASSRPERPVMI